VLPEQIVVAAAVAVATGIGFTVTVVVIGAPGQPLAVGVTVYVAVCAVTEELFKVCAIVEPAPAEVPVNEPALVVTVQSNVVPATVLVNATDVVLPEQIVCGEGDAVATGVGFTVIVTVIGAPGQAFAVGMIV
jgi:hypothetical protein